MRIVIVFAVMLLVTSGAYAQEPRYAAQKRTEFNTILDSLSNLLSSTNPKTSASHDAEPYASSEPAAGETADYVPPPTLLEDYKAAALPPINQPAPAITPEPQQMALPPTRTEMQRQDLEQLVQPSMMSQPQFQPQIQAQPQPRPQYQPQVQRPQYQPQVPSQPQMQQRPQPQFQVRPQYQSPVQQQQVQPVQPVQPQQPVQQAAIPNTPLITVNPAVNTPPVTFAPEGNLAQGRISIQRGSFDPEVNGGAPSGLNGAIDAGEKQAEEKAPAKLDIKMENARSAVSTMEVLDQGQRALKAGQYEGAITLYKSAIKRDPKNRDALFGLATAYHKNGQRPQAKEAYAKLLREYPKFENGLNNMLVFVSEEDPKLALAELDKFAAKNPGFAPVYVQKANIYSNMGDDSTARKNLIKAVNLDPENINYRYNLAILLDKMGDTKQAAELYSQLLEAGAKGMSLPADRTQIQERMVFLSNQNKSS